MRLLKQFSVAFVAAILFVSCATTQSTTSTTSVTNDVKDVSVKIEAPAVTQTLVAKKGAMTEAEIQAWPHKDIYVDSVPGLSLAKAYKFVQNKKGNTVIVGVIDSGIDVEHEDLKNVVWINQDEIAGNGIDDDKNGYVDDIHGWNFLGGEKGQKNPEQLELTRIVKKWTPRFHGKSSEDITEADQSDFKLYTELKELINKKNTSAAKQIEKASDQLQQFQLVKEMVVSANDTIRKVLGDKEVNVTNVSGIILADQKLMNGKLIIMRVLDAGATIEDAFVDLDAVIANNKEIKEHYSNQLNAQYKIDFNGRITGDDPYDITATTYGNNYVIGSKDDESHGTHVSGIIAAERNNGKGMNGVAHNVQIMALRAVPDGDEYDKDIALAIRYAVDNGAKVINMSFGKSYSPNAEWVYDAIAYAAKKDVLLVHAAGNDASDIDSAENFPNDSKDKLVEFADNVITVGAMTRFYDDQLVASFSNYGKKNVDVFAPGLEIYSTFPKNNYESIQGTSMAAPEVAGVAALIRSYYPKLSASKVKQIIMDSGIEYTNEVIKPGSENEKVNFSDLSVSGKIVNAYNALRMAEKMSK